MAVLITGGTGALGREVVRALEASGHRVRIASRRPRPDGTPPNREWARMEMASGDGVEAAVAGAETVVHAASDPRRADAVDVRGTRRLVEAARSAGVGHLVYVSIVGVDQIPLGYYQRKLEAERIVERSGVPYSMLRATQFHTLLEMLVVASARLPFAMVMPTDFRFQSVAPSEVAKRLVLAVDDGARGRLRDFGGPEVLSLGEAADQWKAARGLGKRVVRLPLPGRTAAAFRRGLNTVKEGDHGAVRWRDWLQRDPAP